MLCYYNVHVSKNTWVALSTIYAFYRTKFFQLVVYILTFACKCGNILINSFCI